MLVYIVMLLSTYLFALFGRITGRNELVMPNHEQKLTNHSDSIKWITSKFFLILSFCTLWLVAGLRVNVGTDFREYQTLFYNYREVSIFSNVNIELFYFYLNKGIGYFTENGQWLFVITAFLIYILCYKVILKESVYIELAIFLFITFGFFFSTFNILRQWIACALIFYSFQYIFENRLVKFAIVGIIASLFHTSALVVLPCYFLIRKMRKNSTRIVFMVVATFLSFMPMFILNYMTQAFIQLQVNPKYFRYVGGMAGSGAQGYSFPMFCVLVFIGYLLVKDQLSKINPNSEYHMNILTIAFAVTMLGQNLLIFSRIQFYFLPILIIIIPNMIATFKEEKKVFVYFSVLFLGFVFMVYFLKQNGGEPLPYRSIFHS